MIRFCSITLCVCAMSAISAQAAPTAVSTFDTDLDGWTPSPPGLPAPLLPEVTWQAVGGNPGGFARFDDRTDADTYIQAPAKFLGDWSSLDGVGAIYYDHLIDDIGGNPQFLGFEFKYWITLAGPGGSAAWRENLFQPLPVAWVTNKVPIDKPYWVVTGGTWPGLLADVQEFRIGIEAVNNKGQESGEITGIDNVVIPEPGTLAMLAFGGALLLRRRRRR